MKTILSAALLLVSSISLVAADEAAPKTHAEVGKGMVGIITEMMGGMAKIKDVASAEAFSASMPAIKTKMKALHKAAMALPAPTDAEKAAVNKMMDEAQESAAPAMMEMMMGLSKNPDAEAIGEIIGKAMEDEEMDKVGNELEALYRTEEEEGPGIE